MLSLRDLRFLLEVEQAGSITRGGASLGLSPSSSSRTMSRIREILRDECFVPGQGGLLATDRFDRIRPVIEQMLRCSQELTASSFDPARTTRTFRISTVMAEVEHVLGGVVPAVLRAAPHARIDVCKNENEFEALFTRRADFSIVTGVELPADVHYMNLYRLDRVILLRRGHPLTRIGRALTPEDLMRCGRVSIRTGRLNSWTGPDQSLFPSERYMQNTRLSTTRLNVAWEAMRHTDLICICGWRAAEIAMTRGGLTAIALPREMNATNPWNMLIWADFMHHDPACKWLRGIFSDWSKQEKARVESLAAQGKGPPR